MLTIIQQILKIFIRLIEIYSSWSLDEKEIRVKQIDQYVNNILNSINSSKELLDENAYLKSLTAERTIRYNGYKQQTELVLNAGEGYTKLSETTYMGMNLKALKVKLSILQILNRPLINGDKAKLIAQLLVDVI